MEVKRYLGVRLAAGKIDQTKWFWIASVPTDVGSFSRVGRKRERNRLKETSDRFISASCRI